MKREAWIKEVEENFRISSDGAIELRGELRVNGGKPQEQWRRPYISDLKAIIVNAYNSGFANGVKAQQDVIEKEWEATQGKCSQCEYSGDKMNVSIHEVEDHGEADAHK